MFTTACDQTQLWLQNIYTSDDLSFPDETLANHIHSCAICRSVLVLLMTRLLNVPLSEGDATCDECQEDLAAFIDMERMEGYIPAAQSFPHVWWHLWTCAECLAVYEDTITLVNAEAENEGVSTKVRDHISTPMFWPRMRLRIPRQVIAQTIVGTQLLARLHGAVQAVVPEQKQWSNYQATFSIQSQDDGTWSIIMTMHPQIDGHVILTMETLVLRASFDKHGKAYLAPIPHELLTGVTAPALALHIELHAA